MGVQKGKTGVAELAKVSINAGTGCPNGCRYCFSRYDAVERWKRCEAKDWPVFKPNNNRIDAKAKKVNGIIMFPSAHDITPDNLDVCMTMIRKNLDKGNKMLIVSKADSKCFDTMTRAYLDYKDQLHFMVTIGSVRPEILKFWEPGSPDFDSRLKSLVMAFSRGYKTSVLCEPTLDGYPMYVYEACKEYVTKGFWIGLMNKIDQRCDFSDVSDEDMKHYVQLVRDSWKPDFVKMLYELMKDYPKIIWKDSIKTLLGLEETE